MADTARGLRLARATTRLGDIACTRAPVEAARRAERTFAATGAVAEAANALLIVEIVVMMGVGLCGARRLGGAVRTICIEFKRPIAKNCK